MKREVDIYTEPEVAFDALLDEINKQKRINQDLQSEIRQLRTRDIRQNKNAELLKLENMKLKETLSSLEQKVRELEIELTLPESERTPTNRLIDPYPKQPAYKKFNWRYILVPAVLVAIILMIRANWFQTTPSLKESFQTVSPQNTAAVSNAIGATTATTQAHTENPAAQISETPTTQPTTAEENYLLIENPLNPESMVRVMDSYQPKAKVMAWVNPSDKFRIRSQSPQKMRRTYTMNGKNITVEDYFYKISDKEQWVFGYFTNKRLL
jgi:hypothetical protein